MKLESIIYALTFRLSRIPERATSLFQTFPELTPWKSETPELGKSAPEVIKAITARKQDLISWAQTAIDSDPKVAATAAAIWAKYLERERERGTSALSMAITGPKLWSSLHRFALNWDGRAESMNPFLDLFEASIHCSTCKGFWKQSVETNPPPKGGAEEFFTWTVNLHNAVNRKLEKPEMSVDDARKIHQS